MFIRKPTHQNVLPVAAKDLVFNLWQAAFNGRLQVWVPVTTRKWWPSRQHRVINQIRYLSYSVFVARLRPKQSNVPTKYVKTCALNVTCKSLCISTIQKLYTVQCSLQGRYIFGVQCSKLWSTDDCFNKFFRVPPPRILPSPVRHIRMFFHPLHRHPLY